MPELILPDARFRVSFLDAVHEHIAEDDFFGGTLARELREHGSAWQRPEGFERYVEAVRQEEAEDGRRPEGFVPNTWYWYVDGDTYLGRIQVRHRLTPGSSTTAVTSDTASGPGPGAGGTRPRCCVTCCRTPTRWVLTRSS